MMFETLLAKIVHEVSLLHLETEKKGIGIEPITGSCGGGWSSENHLRRQAALTLSAFGGATGRFSYFMCRLTFNTLFSKRE